jgi:hypothetical protein
MTDNPLQTDTANASAARPTDRRRISKISKRKKPPFLMFEIGGKYNDPSAAQISLVNKAKLHRSSHGLLRAC